MVYKDIGSSEDELKVLDCLMGLFMGGEILLDLLQVNYEKRIAGDSITFQNKYTLMDYLYRQSGNPKLEDGPVQMLWKFLHVLGKNNRSELASIIEKTQANVVDSCVSNRKFNIRANHRMALPIRIMDQILEETSSEVLEDLKAKRGCQGDVKPAAKCKVILSSYIWLKEFRESSFPVRLLEDQSLRTTSSNLWIFKWPLEGPDRILILNGESDQASDSAMRALDFLWDWFRNQKNPINSFVFRISELGVLKDLPDEIGLLHPKSCSIGLLSEDGDD